MAGNSLTPAERTLIAALAEIAVAAYLRPDASNDAAPAGEQPERVPLPDLDRAA